MNEQKDGGPAFPVSSAAIQSMAEVLENVAESQQEALAEEIATIARGMSLRDYFAAKALQGLCANPGGPFQANALNGWGYVNCTGEDIAATAYTMADSMLKARQQ
jgi:hypothetical protein